MNAKKEKDSRETKEKIGIETKVKVEPRYYFSLRSIPFYPYTI